MISLLGSLLGFISSFLPDILHHFKDKKSREFELLLLDKQIQAKKEGHEIDLASIQEHTKQIEIKQLYSYANPPQNSWGGLLASIVRPVITLLLFGLYAGIKIVDFWNHKNFAAIWTDEDQMIYCTIIAFWFGNRTIRKNGNGDGYTNGNGNGK